VAGIALAALALAASVGYTLRPHSSTPVAEAQAPLGALTNTDPGTGYLSIFNHQGWTDRIGNKPALVFAGTDDCPYCAVERWAVVKALSAFGRWSGLAQSDFMPTFDLTASRYRSLYVAFKYTRMDDLKLTRREAREMRDTNPSGGTLWILVADRNTGNTGLDPNLINGMSFAAVQTQLRSASPGASTPGSLTHEINAEANALIAILCHADGMQPQAVCGRPVIRYAVSSLS
jgi:hypothetical protein